MTLSQGLSIRGTTVDSLKADSRRKNTRPHYAMGIHGGFPTDTPANGHDLRVQLSIFRVSILELVLRSDFSRIRSLAGQKWSVSLKA
jgi:hypothetical protein